MDTLTPSTWRSSLTGLGLIAVLAALLLWPIGLTFVSVAQQSESGAGLTGLVQGIAHVFKDPVLQAALSNSLFIAVVVTLGSLVIGVALAIVEGRYDYPGRTILSYLVYLPLVMPPFVGAIGVRYLFGRFGAANTLLDAVGLIDPGDPVDFLGGHRFWGVALMEIIHFFPIIYLNAAAGLGQIDPTLEQAAENLGASTWTRFRRIIIPLMTPSIFGGGAIVFVWSLTELGTPLIFDYDAVAPVQILWGVQELTVSQRPYALASVLLLIALAAYMIVRKLIGSGEMSAASKTPTKAIRRVLPGWKGIATSSGCLLVVVFAALPHVGVLLAALAKPGGWYRSLIPTEWTLDHVHAALTHPLAVGSIGNSLLYAVSASLLTVILGVAIGWYIARSGSRWSSAVDTLSMFPLAVPGLVLAFGYVVMTLHWPVQPLAEFFERHGWNTLASLCQVAGQSPNPFVILVCAYTVRRIPYAVRSVVAGLQQTPRQLELAAMNLGASRLHSFFRITVPLIGAHIFAGALLTFSLTILEVSDSLILAQREVHYPVTKAIYTISHRLGDGPAIACALGIWAMLLMSLSLIGVSRLLGKRMGSMFRV